MISDKVKVGLAKAHKATGGTSTTELLVKTGDSPSPIDPEATSEEWVELVDCLFAVNNAVLSDPAQTTSTGFTASSDVSIKTGDVMRRGGKHYLVSTCDAVNPSGVVLVYKGTLEAQ